MKYLEINSLDNINNVLSLLDAGECQLTGRIEAYSCKPAGDDKKLYKNLETRFSDDFEDFGEIAIVSPFGPLTQQASRRTLYYLIATLNASFPDYDFSNVKPEQFCKQPVVPMVVNSINMSLSNVGPAASEVIQNMWPAIDAEISLSECDIYSFTPDMDSDPAGEDEGCIWSLYYFFYNKKRKRIIFFTCRAVSFLKQAQVQQSDEFLSQANSDIEDNLMETTYHTGWVPFTDLNMAA